MKNKLLKIHKSKTMIFALMLSVLGAVQINLPIVQTLVDPKIYGYITIFISISIAILRVVTTKPLEDK